MKQSFSAVIYKQGINPCVDIPELVSRVFQRKGYIPVRGRLNKDPFKATLVPVGDGKYRLFINGKMRTQAGVDVGDKIKIELELDPQIRTIPVPAAFEQALEQDPEARKQLCQADTVTAQGCFVVHERFEAAGIIAKSDRQGDEEFNEK